jgi:hypothetical protein
LALAVRSKVFEVPLVNQITRKFRRGMGRRINPALGEDRQLRRNGEALVRKARMDGQSVGEQQSGKAVAIIADPMPKLSLKP